jgi:hypothetical protein
VFTLPFPTSTHSTAINIHVHASKQVQCLDIIPFISTQHPSRLCNVYHKSPALASVAPSLAQFSTITKTSPLESIICVPSPSPPGKSKRHAKCACRRQVESTVVTEPKSHPSIHPNQNNQTYMCIVSDPIRSSPVQSSPLSCVCVWPLSKRHSTISNPKPKPNKKESRERIKATGNQLPRGPFHPMHVCVSYRVRWLHYIITIRDIKPQVNIYCAPCRWARRRRIKSRRIAVRRPPPVPCRLRRRLRACADPELVAEPVRQPGAAASLLRVGLGRWRLLLLLGAMSPEDFDALLDRSVPQTVEVEDPRCPSPVSSGSGCVVVLAQVGGEWWG